MLLLDSCKYMRACACTGCQVSTHVCMQMYVHCIKTINNNNSITYYYYNKMGVRRRYVVSTS